MSSRGTEPSARVSHICVDCRSAQNRDQNGVVKAKRAKVLFLPRGLSWSPKGKRGKETLYL